MALGLRSVKRYDKRLGLLGLNEAWMGVDEAESCAKEVNGDEPLKEARVKVRLL